MRSKSKSKSSPYKYFALAIILSTVSVFAFGIISLKEIYRSVIPDVTVLKSQYPVAVGKEGKSILYKLQNDKPKHWRTLKQISKNIVAAVLLSEDAAFFRHPGYDANAIKAAWEHNRKPGVKVKRGASTITQQVVKNIFLTHEKTMTRKIRELILALQLERNFTKKQILEIYLNIVEWGPNVYGVEQAAHKYFGKNAANLNPREGATLAFMLPNPNKYRHSIKEDGELSNFGEDRVETIMSRMLKAGYISEEEFSSYFSDDENQVSSDL